MPLLIVREDIVRMQVDAIVTAGDASPTPAADGGVNGRIHQAAGKGLMAAIRRLGGIRTGKATITPAYDLPCKYVIHTAGPVWRSGAQGEEEQLRACYQSALKLAKGKGLDSIAFPVISSGAYGCPMEKALQVATEAIRAFLKTCPDMTVYLVVYGREAFRVSSKLFDQVAQYIDQHYVDAHAAPRNVQRRTWADTAALPLMQSDDCAAPEKACRRETASRSAPIPSMAAAPPPLAELEQHLRHLDEGFRDMLLRLIDERGMTDSACYSRANVDRKLFSKIRTNPSYTPKKSTVVAFAVALQLDLNATRDLLSRAGYAMSRSNVFDVIVEFFIGNQYYDIDRINQVLFEHDMPLLGSNVG